MHLLDDCAVCSGARLADGIRLFESPEPNKERYTLVMTTCLYNFACWTIRACARSDGTVAVETQSLVGALVFAEEVLLKAVESDDVDVEEW